ncbi:hypothetical protein FA95DRAFT_1401939 [Auriscalpium vulgare]|uniref:Uncharacterized protein n=1 Tax=Auriscalpium vulgare TaxID=40419 RepID=A0ACB8RS09_9AGAM|nr:hypothetical protein FA95DRAFT_1401939 [Auriscalpium vulgare]
MKCRYPNTYVSYTGGAYALSDFVAPCNSRCNVVIATGSLCVLSYITWVNFGRRLPAISLSTSRPPSVLIHSTSNPLHAARALLDSGPHHPPVPTPQDDCSLKFEKIMGERFDASSVLIDDNTEKEVFLRANGHNQPRPGPEGERHVLLHWIVNYTGSGKPFPIPNITGRQIVHLKGQPGMRSVDTFVKFTDSDFASQSKHKHYSLGTFTLAQRKRIIEIATQKVEAHADMKCRVWTRGLLDKMVEDGLPVSQETMNKIYEEVPLSDLEASIPEL